MDKYTKGGVSAEDKTPLCQLSFKCLEDNLLQIAVSGATPLQSRQRCVPLPPISKHTKVGGEG